MRQFPTTSPTVIHPWSTPLLSELFWEIIKWASRGFVWHGFVATGVTTTAEVVRRSSQNRQMLDRQFARFSGSCFRFIIHFVSNRVSVLIPVQTDTFTAEWHVVTFKHATRYEPTSSHQVHCRPSSVNRVHDILFKPLSLWRQHWRHKADISRDDGVWCCQLHVLFQWLCHCQTLTACLYIKV